MRIKHNFLRKLVCSHVHNSPNFVRVLASLLLILCCFLRQGLNILPCVVWNSSCFYFLSAGTKVCSNMPSKNGYFKSQCFSKVLPFFCGERVFPSSSLSLSFAFLHFLKIRSAHTLLKFPILLSQALKHWDYSHLHLTWPFFWIPLWTLMCYDSLVIVGFVPPFSRFGFLLCSTGSSRTQYEYQVGSDLWWSSCLCLQRLELQAGTTSLVFHTLEEVCKLARLWGEEALQGHFQGTCI